MHDSTLTSKLVERLRGMIDDGVLAAGERMRSLRDAAHEEGVSKNTMVEVYERLVALGQLEARPGAGFFVRGSLRTSVERPAHVAQAVDVVSLLREQLEQHYEVRIGDGRLPPAWLEGTERMLSIRSTRAAEEVETDHGYGSPWGYAPLRERIGLLLAERSIRAPAPQILLTQGANHALDLIVRHLLRPHDPVLVDSPGYYPLFGKLKLAQVRLIGVRRNADGPDLDDLAAKATQHRPKAFFTQCFGHNPVGGGIGLSTAHRLLQIASRHDFLVVEDDPFADLMPASLPRLAALDQLERVVYVGSFSKTLSASLRVGYIAAHPILAAELRDLKMVTTVSTSDYVERVVHRLIVRGHYRRHLRRLSARLQAAEAEALDALRRAGLRVRTGSGGGYYLWAELPRGVDEQRLTRSAAEHEIFLAPGSVFRVDKRDDEHALRINVAYATDRRFLAFLRAQRQAARTK